MKDGKFGVMGECRVCASKRTKQYLKEHPECPERYNRRKRERYKNEPDFRALVKERDRKFKDAYPEYNREYQREWRKTHPDYYRKIYAKRKEMKQKS